MKLSIITAVLNANPFLEECIRSIASQTHGEIEHVVIDGGSTDGTIDIIRAHESSIARWVSRRDDGMYDALNAGIGMATGDVIGFLHADDLYAHDRVLEEVASAMAETGTDSCYGDLVYVDRRDAGRVVRHWKSGPFKRGKFKQGWMPPHPTFFVKRDVYVRHGAFDTSFRIAADYELMLRFLERHAISTVYLPEVLITMRTGGLSNRSLRNILVKTREDFMAWKANHLKVGPLTIPLKNITKIPQLF
jgi:glycosyltransferase